MQIESINNLCIKENINNNSENNNNNINNNKLDRNIFNDN